MARSMDADLWLLLTEEEEAQYLARSVRAAAQRCADLVPCMAPGCEGLAVAGNGAADHGGHGSRLASYHCEQPAHHLTDAMCHKKCTFWAYPTL